MSSTRVEASIALLTGVVIVVFALGWFAPAAGDATAMGGIAVSPNETVEMTVWTAPAATFDSLDAAGAIRRAVENGTLTRDATIAERDAVVFAIESAETLDALARERETGQTDTAAFVDLVTRSDEHQFEIQRLNQSVTAESRVNLTATAAAGGLRVVPDGSTDTLYVALQTDRAVLDGLYTAINGSSQYRTTYTIADSVPRRARGTWRAVDRTVEFENRRYGAGIVLGADEPCHRLTARTSVAPGTELEIRLNRSTGRPPLRATAVVEPDGTVAAPLETRNLSAGTRYGVVVPGVERDVTEGVVAPDAGPVGQTSVALADQSSRGDTVAVAEVTTERGGFVVLYPEPALDEIVSRTSSGACALTRLNRSAAAEHVLGVSDYLSPGVHTNVPVHLDTALGRNQTLAAVLHPDTNENRAFDFPAVESAGRPSIEPKTDDPIALNGSLVADRALVSVTASASAEPTTRTSTRTVSPASPTETTTTTGAAADTTTAAGVGFTAALAVLAVLAFVVLGRRE